MTINGSTVTGGTPTNNSGGDLADWTAVKAALAAIGFNHVPRPSYIPLAEGSTAPSITSADNAAFTVGSAGTFTVTTTGTPAASLTETGALPSGVTFTDNNDGTATISGTPGAGTAGSYPLTITATNGVGTDATQSFTLTVNAAFVPVTGITGVPTAATAGTDLTLTGTVAPADATNKTIAWSVKDAGTTGATVSGNTLSTTAAGSATVTAKITNGATATSDYTQDFTITVNAAFVPVTGITGVPTAATAGTDLTLTGTVAPADATNKTIAWSVKDAGTTGADISGNVLSTTAAGTVTVTAKITNGATATSDYTQDFTITVNAAFVPVTGITGVPTTASAGTALTLAGTVAPASATNKTIAWSVKDAGTTGASINGNVLSTTAAGSATVTAKITNGLTATTDYTQDFTITVNAAFVPVTGITGVPTAATAGTDLTLTGTVAPANATNKTIAWSVKDAGTTGAYITGNTLSTTAAGTATVTAKITNGLTATTDYMQDFTITVSAAPPVFVPVTGITGVPTTATAGTDLTLAGTVAPANATNKTITWSVKDAGTTGADISGNVLSTTAAGMVTVTAKITNGLTATTDYTQDFTITVSAAPAVTSLSPAIGPSAGGTLVTITGSGFTGATGVSFGGTAATSFTVRSDTSITAVSPARAAGTVDVTVSTPVGASATVSGDQFTYSGNELVGWWKLNEGTGATAADSSGYGYDGTLTDPVWSADYTSDTSHPVDASLDFSGGLSQFTASAPTVLTKNVSIAAWVKWDGTTGAYQTILHMGDPWSDGYGLHLDAGGNLNILLGGQAWLATTVTLPVNTWAHVAAVEGNSGSWTIYLNGEPAGKVTGTPIRPSGDFIIGYAAHAVSAGPTWFHGVIDEVCVYSAALTDTQIRQLAALPGEDFVPVTGITGVPTSATAGTDLTLTGTVDPAYATNTTIVWSVKNAGTTGAGINGNVLTTTAAGTVIVTATIPNGLAVSTDYTQDFTITVKAAFVPVKSISGVPAKGTADIDLTLTGTVNPINATNKDITWSVKTAGTTGASITGNTLSAKAAGTVIITATIPNGLTDSTDYTQDFTIAIAPAATVPTVTAVSAGYNSIRLSWGAVMGTGGYEIYRATTRNGRYAKAGAIMSGSTVTWTDTGLTTGKTYYYKMRAYRTVGGDTVFGKYSAVSPAKPLLAAPASVNTAQASINSIRITWGEVAGATRYEVYRSTARAGTYKLLTITRSESYTNTGVRKGTTYYYKVRAYRLVGSTKVFGPYSTIISGTTSLNASRNPWKRIVL